MELDDSSRYVLTNYARAVVHLRRQIEAKRFGLLLGAGVSKSFNVPGWEELVNSIANDPNVNGTHLITGNASTATYPYKTEILQRHFRAQEFAKPSALTLRERENAIYASWLKVCSKHLYENVPRSPAEAIDAHPYMGDLVPLVQKSHITVTLNFDDYLEQALSIASARSGENKTRGYEIVTNPWIQFRRPDSVIYHLHGVIKQNLMEFPADRFVFSETSYARQYVGPDGHDSSFLLSHFSKNSCLLVGCSLEDAVRTVLMRGTYVSPGNYHYYVKHLDSNDELTPEVRKAISDTNFNVYNLITLFLTTPQIRALLRLISESTVPDDLLKDWASLCGKPLHYFYYVTGPLGVGKSTSTNLLRNLVVVDEWLRERPQILGALWTTLSEQDERDADRWLLAQFKAKNDTLRHSLPAITLVDRPPLDPLAFTKRNKHRAKAKAILDAVCPDRKWQIVSGTVILLKGDPSDLFARVLATGRDEYTAEALSKMQEDLSNIYNMPGVRTIETDGLSIQEVVKQIAETIHCEDYVPCDLQGSLKAVAGEA